MNQDEKKARLLGSLLLFTQVFYKLRTGREFEISQPMGRESHHVIISRVLTSTKNNELNRVIINCPPRYGKTELAIHYIAWMLARYPDSNFLYISYSHMLAKKQTQTIRNIVNMPEYKSLFGVKISSESSAKDNFETVQGGSIYAAGSGGTITGRGAGIQNCDRFGGSIIIDDILKPDDATSDTVRDSVNDWYFNTLQSRVNSPSTPIIFIGQRLHEEDLPGYLMKEGGLEKWESVIIPALDIKNNALNPSMHTVEKLLMMKEKSPYVFYSQYQQIPTAPGGMLFKGEWLRRLYEEPEFLSTFITCDTAETDKTYNDATVFSFWGLYKIKQGDIETDLYGLHWIDCYECWIEPKDLKDEFLSFYNSCMRHNVKPSLSAIEKKSTGTTLVSVLKGTPGLNIREIERNCSTSKVNRFIEIQYYLSSGLVSIMAYADHEQKVDKHLSKITDNNTHRYDDIADTLADAVKLALIDKLIPRLYGKKDTTDDIISSMAKDLNRRARISQKSWDR